MPDETLPAPPPPLPRAARLLLLAVFVVFLHQFLVGLADNTLPISHALANGPDSEAVEEERRLLYVGITRARMHLALSWALSRNPGGRQTRRPSRFLNGIAPHSQSDTAGRPRKQRGPTPRCRVCNNALTTPAAVMLRRCEGCPSDIDEQLLADLKDWRLRTSKEMSVPAYVVFTDNTLIAIADQGRALQGRHLIEAVGDLAGNRRSQGPRGQMNLSGVAHHHDHGHGLAQRSAQREETAADNAGPGVGQHHVGDGLPTRRSQRQRPFALRARDGLANVETDGRDVRQDHDRQDQRGCEQTVARDIGGSAQ